MEKNNEKKQFIVPEKIPLLPVRDMVLFPQIVLSLFVGREASLQAVNNALENDHIIFLVTQKNPEDDDPKPEEIYNIGTVATIIKIFEFSDGKVKILVQGIVKAKIKKFIQDKSAYYVEVEEIEESPLAELDLETEALMRNVKEQSNKIISMRGILAPDMSSVLGMIDDPGRLADIIASNLRLKIKDSQQILETNNPAKRLKKVSEFLGKEVELSVMQAKIQSQAKDEMTKTQREYFLREQLRAIKNELGEIDERSKEIAEFNAKIKKAKMPKEAENEATKQLKRLEQMHPDAAESSIVRTYLDWLVEIPWSKSTKDRLDIKQAKKVLDDDHYNLEKVKERVLEYLAVRKLNRDMKGPILCFIGPPGVGKTSLGKSIARALGRKFTRISLGGVRDEAEIRGHRRTYIGALPGKIIQGIKQAGSNNPVFMIDEIDKIGADFRGDPAAALLEVLDPEQNNDFSDHYLHVHFDLSKVIFIATGNLVDPIIPALMDRMEVINLSGYTDKEKLKIARQFLLPRQLKENGITPKILKISDEAILMIISKYTKEAGLRNLERELASVCRKVARKVAEDEKGNFQITSGNLHKYLGVAKYISDAKQENNEVGVATGLAWTQAGGEILNVEASIMKGKGNLILTGHLGDVMKESAQAALSYARSKEKELNLDSGFYEKLDVHIHVPEGATPKDGPSAGVTMATALISALSKKPVKKNIAMTGEITLRGRILPIGGLKEKVLAALRSKIFTVIIPEQNRKDLADIPPQIKKKINFVFAKNMDDILKVALWNN